MALLVAHTTLLEIPCHGSICCVAPVDCWGSVFDPCFVVQCLVSFLVLQWKRGLPVTFLGCTTIRRKPFRRYDNWSHTTPWCLVTVDVLWLFLAVRWAGLQCVVMVTRLLFFRNLAYVISIDSYVRIS